MSQEESKQDLFYHVDSNSYVSLTQKEESYQLEVSHHENGEFKGVKVTTQSFKHTLRGDVYVLDSVKSGKGRKRETDLYDLVLKKAFEILKVPHTYIATTSATSIKEFAQSLTGDRSEITIVFMSGDTSIGEFINSLKEVDTHCSINLSVIPEGTGNSFSYSIGTYNQVEALQKLFSSREKKPLNIYDAIFPKGTVYLDQDSEGDVIDTPLKFLVVVSWAFHAALVADSDTPELRKYGTERFKMAAQSNLSTPQEYHGSVTIGKHVYKGPFAYLIFTPSVRFEKSFDISPNGDIFKNSMYLISFKSRPENAGGCIMDIMGKVYDNGNHVKDDRVTYQEIVNEEIILKIDPFQDRKHRRFCIDGTILLVPEGENVIKLKSSGNNQKNWSIFLLV